MTSIYKKILAALVLCLTMPMAAWSMGVDGMRAIYGDESAVSTGAETAGAVMCHVADGLMGMDRDGDLFGRHCFDDTRKMPDRTTEALAKAFRDPSSCLVPFHRLNAPITKVRGDLTQLPDSFEGWTVYLYTIPNYRKDDGTLDVRMGEAMKPQFPMDCSFMCRKGDQKLYFLATFIYPSEEPAPAPAPVVAAPAPASTPVAPAASTPEPVEPVSPAMGAVLLDDTVTLPPADPAAVESKPDAADA